MSSSSSSTAPPKKRRKRKTSTTPKISFDFATLCGPTQQSKDGDDYSRDRIEMKNNIVHEQPKPKQVTKSQTKEDNKRKKNNKEILITIVPQQQKNNAPKVYGNQKVWMSLDKWLINSVKSTTGINMIVLTGPPGVGKTFGTRALLEKHGYAIEETSAIDYNYAVTKKEAFLEHIKTKLLRFLFFKQSFGGNPIAGIMDEVDGLQSTCLTQVLKYMMKFGRNQMGPLICIATNSQAPAIKHLVAHCKQSKIELNHLRLYPLLPNDMMKILNDNRDKLPPGLTQQDWNSLILQHYGDARAMLNSACFLNASTNKKQTTNNINDMLTNNYRTSDVNIFQITENILLSNVSNRNKLGYDILSLEFICDDKGQKSILDHMVFYNYINAVDKRRKQMLPPTQKKEGDQDNLNALKTIMHISEGFSTGDNNILFSDNLIQQYPVSLVTSLIYMNKLDSRCINKMNHNVAQFPSKTYFNVMTKIGDHVYCQQDENIKELLKSHICRKITDNKNYECQDICNALLKELGWLTFDTRQGSYSKYSMDKINSWWKTTKYFQQHSRVLTKTFFCSSTETHISNHQSIGNV